MQSHGQIQLSAAIFNAVCANRLYHTPQRARRITPGLPLLTHTTSLLSTPLSVVFLFPSPFHKFSRTFQAFFTNFREFFSSSSRISQVLFHEFWRIFQILLTDFSGPFHEFSTFQAFFTTFHEFFEPLSRSFAGLFHDFSRTSQALS